MYCNTVNYVGQYPQPIVVSRDRPFT